MYKRDLIKNLYSMGVRYFDKEGRGRVNLHHLKYYELCKLYEELNKNNEN